MTKTRAAAVAAKAHVRSATPADLPRIRDILNAEILTSTASWTIVARSEQDMADWLAARQDQGFPVLVAEDPATGEVAGYASYGPFRTGQGYAGTVEHSVYVDAECRGYGIAACLMGALIERARAAGKRLMIGGISADQEASLRLHRGRPAPRGGPQGRPAAGSGLHGAQAGPGIRRDPPALGGGRPGGSD